MEITEVRIKLMDEAGDRLLAFCSITFDDAFVIRDLKIIDGTHGPFVAMPSRKLTSRCPNCGTKNHLRAAHCNQCGQKLKEGRAAKDEMGRAKLYADIAHPINSSCREQIQERIVAEFHSELDRSQQPGYISRYEEFDAGEDYTHQVETEAEPRASAQREREPAQREKDPAHEAPPAPHHQSVASGKSEAPHSTKPAAASHIPSAAPHRSVKPLVTPPPPQNASRGSFGSGIF